MSQGSDKPLRILQVLRAPVGGLFRHVSDLTQALAARGHAVGVVVDSLASDGLTAERLHRLAPHATLGIHPMPMPRVLGRGDLTAPLAVRRLTAQLDVDIVHGHGAKGGLYARLGCAGRHRAALYTPHGGVLHFSSINGVIFQSLERLLLPFTDAVVFESAFARETFHRLIGKPRCPDPVIHNGLAEVEFEPVTPVANAHDFVFIGELREVKGVRHLLEALVDLHDKGGRPATLAMAGSGPDLDTFKAEIVRLGLSDRVTLLGVRPARAALPQGRIMVVPSLAESLPYVVLEAGAAGLPMIATRVGGIPEIFGPTAASLVPPADTGALRSAMQRALDAGAEPGQEAAQRRDHIRSRFTIARMTDAIDNLYRSVLASRRKT